MQDKKNIRLGILYLSLTLGLIVLIFRFGITAAVGMAELIQGKDNEEVSSLTEIIVPSPQINSLPNATNSAQLSLSGYSLSNQKVEIYNNDSPVESLEADSEGFFSGEVTLFLGLNKIYAIAKNSEDKESFPSSTYSVFYSDSPPLLEVTEPQDDVLIKKNKDLLIKGKAETTSKLTVNGHVVVISSDGSFECSIGLEEGENHFVVVCTDPAQNKTTKEFTVRFQP